MHHRPLANLAGEIRRLRKASITRVNAAGGKAQMLTSDLGITALRMISQDKNNLEIADLVLKWIDKRASRTSTMTSCSGCGSEEDEPNREGKVG